MIKNNAQQLQQLSALFLFANLPFYFNEVQRWSLVAFVICSVFDIILNQRWKYVLTNKLSFSIALLMIVQFVLLLVFYPLEQETRLYSTLVEQRLPYLVFGILGICYLQGKTWEPKHFAYVSIAVSLGIIGFVLYQIGYERLSSPNYTLNVFNVVRHEYIHAHMAVNIFFCISMLLSFHLLRNSQYTSVKILLALYYALIYFVVITSDGRIGLIGANLTLIFNVLSLLKGRKCWIWSIAVLLLALAAGSFFFHPKRHETFDNENNPRLYIWNIGISLIKESPWIGYGAETAAENMRQRMLNNDNLIAIDDEMLMPNLKNNESLLAAHPHNELLQCQMEYGIMGILSMAALWVLVFVMLFKKKLHPYFVCFWVIICLQLCTETVHTSMGEVAFCFYLLMLLQTPISMPQKVSPNNAAL